MATALITEKTMKSDTKRRPIVRNLEERTALDSDQEIPTIDSSGSERSIMVGSGCSSSRVNYEENKNEFVQMTQAKLKFLEDQIERGVDPKVFVNRIGEDTDATTEIEIQLQLLKETVEEEKKWRQRKIQFDKCKAMRIEKASTKVNLTLAERRKTKVAMVREANQLWADLSATLKKLEKKKLMSKKNIVVCKRICFKDGWRVLPERKTKLSKALHQQMMIAGILKEDPAPI